MRAMNVVVTGNRGYVGSVLCPLLRDAGHAVSGIDTDLFARCSFGEDPEAFPTRAVDIRDVTPAHFENTDAVIHLAALSNDDLSRFDPELTDAINHRGAVRVARAAKEAGVRTFVLASSCSIYGAAGDAWIEEDSPIRPLTPYAASKAAAEESIEALADRDFAPVFLRAATVYGLSPRVRFDLVANNLMAWALSTGEVRLKSDGSAWRPLLHVRDFAASLTGVLAADLGRLGGQAYNLGRTEDNFIVSKIAEFICEVVPGSRIVYENRSFVDRRSYRVNCDRFTSVLPQSPFSWNAPTGLLDLYQALRPLHPEPDDFEGVRYQRIAHLKGLLARGVLTGDLRPAALVS